MSAEAQRVKGEGEGRQSASHLPWTEAETLGSEWARDVRVQLVSENRPACGGWPGTLSEARLRITGIISPARAVAGRITVTVPEFERMAGALYASARNAWRLYSAPEKRIDDVE